MELLLQKFSQQHEARAVLGVLFGAMGVIMLVVAFHLNF